jgi:hypothetical protein
VANVRQELHDRQADRALTAAGLAHNPDTFALGDGEADPVDGTDVGGPKMEFRAKILDLEDVCHLTTPS